LTTTDQGNPEARAKITSRIDGISGVQPEGCANCHNQETDNQRIEVGLDGLVTPINNSKDQAYEESSANKLITEGTKCSDETLRVCVKNPPETILSSWLGNLANGQFTHLQSMGECTLVDKVEDGGSNERTKYLGSPVRKHLTPGEFTSHGETQRHSRVD